MKTLALSAVVVLLSASHAFALGVGDTAPSASLNDIQIDDTVVNESIYTRATGTSYVMLEFFETTCDACQENLPIVSQLAHDIAATTTTRLIGLEDQTTVQTYVDANRSLFQFPTAVDADETVADAFGIQYVPSIFIVDANNKILYSDVGVLADSDIAQIKSLVAQ